MGEATRTSTEAASVSRRRFGALALRSLAALAGARLLGSGGPGPARAAAPPSPAGGPALAAVKGAPAAATRRAVELLGGMAAFVRAGQRVVVKPNIGWDRAPDQAVNTHPDVVATVVRLCLEAGAGEVLVFDRPCNDPRLCYRRSGIEAAVEGIGDRRARIFIPDDRKYVAVRVPGAPAATAPFMIYEDAARADVFVNVPIAKDHGLCLLTMGMKNVMGVLGGDRGQMHAGFDEKIVALNRARPSHLVVLDATRILVANGPQGGRPEDVRRPGVVVAGNDVVAVDAYATRFFGLAPQDVSHLIRAAARGLGTIDLSTVRAREEAL